MLPSLSIGTDRDQRFRMFGLSPRGIVPPARRAAPECTRFSRRAIQGRRAST
jgi:hypothetical protein